MLIPLPAALDAQLQRDAGISHFEYAVMAALSQVPGRILRMSVLAMLTDGSLPRMPCRRAAGKTRLGAPCPDPGDGRYTLAILTCEGQAKVTAAAPGHVAELRRLIFDALTKAQTRQLREIGRRIIRAIDPNGPCLRYHPIRCGHLHGGTRVTSKPTSRGRRW